MCLQLATVTGLGEMVKDGGDEREVESSWSSLIQSISLYGVLCTVDLSLYVDGN